MSGRGGVFGRAAIVALSASLFVGMTITCAFGYGWSPVSNPATQSITGVSFTSAENGWIVCDNSTVLHTTNGGSTWTAVSANTDVPLSGVRFVDADNGWITGQSNVIRHTTDGGATWLPQSTSYNAALSRPFALDAMHAWIPVTGAGGLIAQTADGGAGWTYGYLPIYDGLTDAAFSDPLNGWVVGTSGAIYRTRDGGSTWETKTPDGFSEWLYGVSTVDTQGAFAVSTSGVALSLWDDGEDSEVTTRSTPAASLYCVKAVGTKGEAFAAGWDAIVHTNDWGGTWQLVSSPGPVTLRDLSFPDPFTGFAAGDGGTLLKFTAPVAPGAHSAETTDAQAVVVSWDPSPDAVAYDILYDHGMRQNYLGTSVQIASILAGESDFAVRAVTTEGLYSEWSTATITNHEVIPAMPALSAPAYVSTPSVGVTWPGVPGAVRYEYRLNEGSPNTTSTTSVALSLASGDNLIEVRSWSNRSSSSWASLHVEYAIPRTQWLSLTRTPTAIAYSATGVTVSGTTGGHATTVSVEVKPVGGVWAPTGIILRSDSAGILPKRWVTIKSNASIRLVFKGDAHWKPATSAAVAVTYSPLAKTPSVPSVYRYRRFTTSIRVYTPRSNPSGIVTFTYYRRVGSGSSATWKKVTTLTATAGRWGSNSALYTGKYTATRRGAWKVTATYWGKGPYANRTVSKSFTVH